MRSSPSPVSVFEFGFFFSFFCGFAFSRRIYLYFFSFSFWIGNLILRPWSPLPLVHPADPIPPIVFRDQWTDSYAGILLCELVMVATYSLKAVGWVWLCWMGGLVLFLFLFFSFWLWFWISMRIPCSVVGSMVVRHRPHPTHILGHKVISGPDSFAHTLLCELGRESPLISISNRVRVSLVMLDG